MHESRTLRFAAALVVCLTVSATAHASSSIRYPDFPPPSISLERLRAPVASPPPALISWARAFYVAVFRPRTPVHVYNVNTHETATFYFGDDGHLEDESEMRSLKKIFRCRRTGKRRKPHPGILRILADVARQYPGRTIEIVSAYRAPPYGVPNSKHFHGRAIDLRVQGVPIQQVRDYLFRTNEHVGVGYYRGQNFVHVDYRPGYAKLGWTSKRRGAAYRFHPKWERDIRAEAQAREQQKAAEHGATATLSVR